MINIEINALEESRELEIMRIKEAGKTLAYELDKMFLEHGYPKPKMIKIDETIFKVECKE